MPDRSDASLLTWEDTPIAAIGSDSLSQVSRQLVGYVLSQVSRDAPGERLSAAPQAHADVATCWI